MYPDAEMVGPRQQFRGLIFFVRVLQDGGERALRKTFSV
jgi:hypothetical protein